MSPSASDTAAPLLDVRGLVTEFSSRQGPVRAVDGVSFSIGHGEVVCLVGESGSGKSAIGFSILRLIDEPGRIVSGKVCLEGTDLLALPETQMERLRGDRISMIFQEPMTALNPAKRVGKQIAEALLTHRKVPASEALRQAEGLLLRVGIEDAETRIHAYPHQLSGGMRQRVMIAIAIASRPALIIADEPTTALDVTVQAQVIDLLFELQADMGSAVLFITHDLGLVAEIADRVIVLYAGQVVEEARLEDLFRHPRHPYTVALLASVPDVRSARIKGRALPTILGVPPRPGEIDAGCRFRNRCAHARPVCGSSPPFFTLDDGHRARCWMLDDTQTGFD